jgi:hypothetical protein
VLAAGAAMVVTAALGLLVLRPGAMAAIAVGLAVASLVVGGELGRRGAELPAFGALVLGAGACLLVWPLAAVVLAVAALVAAVALRAPVPAFLAALLVLGSEGVLKARLAAEGVPSAEPTGALVADVLLALALVGLVALDRGRSVAAVWRGAGRAERVVWSVLGAWLVASVVQVPLSPNLTDAVQGLRLTQGYLPLVVAGIVLFATPDEGGRRLRALLWVFAVVAGYAALLAVVDPPAWHVSYAFERSPHVNFGDVIRDFGSFSSVIALASFLVPVAVFALVVALLRPDVRLLGTTVFLLASIGVVASYVRIGLVALGVGAAVAVCALVVGRATATRTKILAVGAVIVAAGGVYAGAIAASGVTSRTETRAQGLRDPLADQSIKDRLDTWRTSLRTTRDNLLTGTGIGTVGHATTVGRTNRYTDNAFLKILQEQGVVLGAMFIAGIFGAVALAARRLVRLGAAERPVAVAALGAVAAFLTLCLLGEYIEQAGKAVFWSMLGVLLWFAYGAGGARPEDGVERDAAVG